MFSCFSCRYSDKDLANLLAVKPDLCGKKFEVKINEVYFVGFPLQISGSSEPAGQRRQISTLSSFNVVFALPVSWRNMFYVIYASEISAHTAPCSLCQGQTEESLLTHYQDVAKHLAIGLRHEERRCGYLTQQKNIMWTIQDEVALQPEGLLSSISPFSVISMLHGVFQIP